jgi:hypothetical protein
MDIDDRLQALAKSLELVVSLHRDNEGRIQALTQGLELVVSLQRDNEKRLAQVMDTMNRLGRIIEIHEQRHDEHDARLDDLERKRNS